MPQRYWDLTADTPQPIDTVTTPPPTVNIVTDKHYHHLQTSPSKSWLVVHNLGKYPSVTVVDSAKSVVMGGIEYIDTNTAVLTFSSAFSGEAYFN